MSTQSESIQLTAVVNGNNFSSWNFTYGGTTYGPGTYPSITVADKNDADFSVTITNPAPYTDKTKVISFANSDPVWTQSGSKPTGPNSNSKEIHKVSGEGTANLSFKDHNWNKNNLNYVLNFNNASQLDPIIGNQGGGPPGFNYLLWGSIGAVALVALVALVVLVLRPMLRKSDHIE